MENTLKQEINKMLHDEIDFRTVKAEDGGKKGAMNPGTVPPTIAEMTRRFTDKRAEYEANGWQLGTTEPAALIGEGVQVYARQIAAWAYGPSMTNDGNPSKWQMENRGALNPQIA